jgi:hypothetical protein
MGADRATAARRRWARGISLAAVLALASALAPAAATAASVRAEEQQGASLLRQFEAGGQSCRSLSTDQFERIGEYVMGRMLGSTSLHEAMNEQMAQTMGKRGEERMHVFMGQRFTGCARGRVPAGFGSMMGMMGSFMAGGGGGIRGGGAGGSGGMMGSNGNGFGSSNTRASADDGWSGADTVMVTLMGLLIALVAGGLAVTRPWRRSSGQTPLEILQARYARGELEHEEYERRQKALGGLT